jgi:transposase InsO family protein
MAQMKNKVIESVYRNSPAAYTGVEPILRESKKRDPSITRKDVLRFLHANHAYTITRPVRRRFRRLMTIASGIDCDWQADLADFSNIVMFNDEFRWLLVCIDVLSRQLMVEPLKTKRPVDVKAGFEAIFERTNRKPWTIYSDRGMEFCARLMRDFFAEQDIDKIEIDTSPAIHCAMAEHANRMIKTRLYKYFTDQNTWRWIDVIQRIVDQLNHSYNRVLKMRPIDVTPQNEQTVRAMLIAQRWHKLKPRFAVGDFVRMDRETDTFEKGYEAGNFTEEVFKVIQVCDTDPVTYRLSDLQGERVTGQFYNESLSPVRDGDGGNAMKRRIQTVLKTRRKNGRKEQLVEYIGYPAKFNEWIPA